VEPGKKMNKRNKRRDPESDEGESQKCEDYEKFDLIKENSFSFWGKSDNRLEIILYFHAFIDRFI